MKINWKVRFLNKAFWVGFIPALILLIQAIAEVFGFKLDLGDLGNRLIEVIGILFSILTMLGIVSDPTTSGVSDSEQALTYTEPRK